MGSYGKKGFPVKLIRNAFDLLPEGLLISTMEGIPLLTNKKMQELSKGITDNHLVNANQFWDFLQNTKGNDRFLRVEFAELPTFLTKDQIAWCFSKKSIYPSGVEHIEILAQDITEQYQLSLQIMGKNEELKKQNARLDDLMKNTVHMSQMEEILDSKIRVHYEMGRTTLATSNYLDMKPGITKDELLQMWRDMLDKLEVSLFSEAEAFDARNELVEMAQNCNCQLVFEGISPMANPLFLTAVREGLVNSIRHGQATSVVARLELVQDKALLTIRDNGKGIKDTYSEGGGIGNLRQKVNKVGGSIRLYSVSSGRGAVLEVALPPEALFGGRV